MGRMSSTHASPTYPAATLVPSQFLTERDAARYVCMSVHFLRQARVKGYGPSYARLGRSIRYRLSDLESWLSQRIVRTRER